MGYMFNKQLRGYNTEEVDDTIETLEKKIQETTLQIRRLEKELDKVKKKISRWLIVNLLNERPMKRFPVLL
jgi:DivIVA protein.